MPTCAALFFSLCAPLFANAGLSLISAARAGDGELARQLIADGASLDAGANPNTIGARGEYRGATALDYAEEGDYSETAQMLAQ